MTSYRLVGKIQRMLRKETEDMASSKDYLEFVLEQLSLLDGITSRAMMGEFMLYYNGKLFGGVYDDRLLVKIIPASTEMLEDADQELPYEGAKPMYLVDEIENKEFLKELVEAMCPELPEPKKRK